MQLDLIMQTVLPAGLIIIMFGIGLSLTRQEFLNVFGHRTALLVGLAAQIIGLPLAAAITIQLFDLSPVYALGLMIIACSPGGATSNLFSYLMKGDVALSVSLTAFSSVLCIFSVPLILTYASELLLGNSRIVRLPPENIFLPLIILVLLPLLVGMIARRHFPAWAMKMHRPPHCSRCLSSFRASVTCFTWSTSAFSPMPQIWGELSAFFFCWQHYSGTYVPE